MRMSFGKMGLRASAFALACVALVGADAKAAALQTYSTTSKIYNDGIDGANVISFNPVAAGAFTAPSNIGLGEFVVSTLKDWESTTYKDTRFEITYHPLTVDGEDYPTDAQPIVLTGMLNGMVTGTQAIGLKATFDTITNPIFSTDKYLSTISLLDNPVSLVAPSAGGRTTVQANVITGPVKTPEPATVVILATALVGLGLRQRLRAARKAG